MFLAKTQTVPNLRLPITSGYRKKNQKTHGFSDPFTTPFYFFTKVSLVTVPDFEDPIKL